MTATGRGFVRFTACAALLATFGVAQAQDGGLVESHRIGGGFHVLTGSGVTAPGFEIFYDIPLMENLVLGPDARFGFPGGGALIDLAAQLKGRYPFALGPGEAEVYLAVPLGLGFITAASEPAGFSYGILPGFLYFFSGGLGAYVELGWSGIAADVNVNGFTFNLGLEGAL